jgi:hypothetical protein
MIEGTVGSAGPGLLRITNGGETPWTLRLHSSTSTSGLYRWRVSRTRLTLTKVRDSVPDRATVFWGTWKRK